MDGPQPPPVLGASDRALTELHDVALLDLDGVTYVGDHSVPHAAEALAAAGAVGMRCEYVTNNALRTPDQVAVRLRGFGIPADASEVVTSAQAAARILGDRLAAGASVLVAGGEGLRAALAEAGLVVLGYDPTLDYRRLAEAALAVRRGALFVACNRDATVPTERGPMAGMGALTAFVATASGREPIVAGKPEPALHAESVRRSHALRPIVVGDRLDTDIEGAVRARTPSLLVLTGVTDLATLAAAPPHRRPTYLAEDLRGLLHSHPAAQDGRCGQARAELRDGGVVVSGGTPLDAARAGLTVAWEHLDRTGTAVELRI
jgi:HAD superfamily hydrolase (TIGR01450 family)